MKGPVAGGKPSFLEELALRKKKGPVELEEGITSSSTTSGALPAKKLSFLEELAKKRGVSGDTNTLPVEVLEEVVPRSKPSFLQELQLKSKK